MTDKELLAAAARAAGIVCSWAHEDEADYSAKTEGMWLNGARSPDNSKFWNPLTDDGDALRLVVELMLTITMRHHECEVFDEDGQFLASESLHCPPDARQELVRRAIVRAAAALDSGHNAAAVPP